MREIKEALKKIEKLSKGAALSSASVYYITQINKLAKRALGLLEKS